MNAFLGALRAELWKLRRTSAIALAFLAPYCVVLLLFVFAWSEGPDLAGREATGGWRWLVGAVFSAWCLVFLPLTLALLSARAAAVEHRAGGFQRLFTLPLPRPVLYLAKQGAVAVLVAASHGVLALGTLLAGYLLRWLVPGGGFDGPAPLSAVAGLTLGAYLAGGFALGLQTWVALVRADFALPVAFGFLATVALVLTSSMLPDLVVYLPWYYPVAAVQDGVAAPVPWTWPLLGAGTGALFTLVAAGAFARRDVD